MDHEGYKYNLGRGTIKGKKEERKEREKEFEILFPKLKNEPKVLIKDVTSSLYRAEITLFFCVLEEFCCSEIRFIH